MTSSTLFSQILTKLAQQPSELQPYQQRVIDRLMNPDQPGLLVIHGVGTGKTRTSIEALKKLNLPADVVVPAALQENFKKELLKWTGKEQQDYPLDIETQPSVARFGLQKDKKKGVLLVDESHKGRTYTGKLINELKKTEALKRILLTATPSFNHPREIAPQINLVAGKEVLPESPKDFDSRFIATEKIDPPFLQKLMGVKPGEREILKNKKELERVLGKYTDYSPGSTEGFPSVNEEEIKVPMTSKQMEIYNTIMGKAPWWVKQKVKWGLPPDKSEIEKMKAFLIGAREISDSTAGFTKNRDIEAPKIDKAFLEFSKRLQEDPTTKAVIYSNFINSTLEPYKARLQKAKIPFGEFSGNVPDAVREQAVRDYNAGKINALLISAAGAEGLDLKKTRLLQLLSPYYNEELEKQVIGRAKRYKSHEGLPPEKQNVTVQRYLATPPSSLWSRFISGKNPQGADEYIRNLALNKSKLTDQLLEIMRKQNTQQL